MATATATLRKMYIDGKWWPPRTAGPSASSTRPPRKSSPRWPTAAGPTPSRALEAAGKAMPAWMKLTAWDRAKVLKKTAELMRERADAIARTLTMEQGKPLAEAKAEVLHSADTFEWFAEEGKRAYGQLIPNSAPGKRHVTLKHPVGVVGAISPWNFPITLQVAQDRAGPGGRLHHRLQAGQPDAAVPGAGLRVPGRGRPAGRRRQPGHRARPRRSPTSSWKTPSAARSASPARPRSASS